MTRDIMTVSRKMRQVWVRAGLGSGIALVVLLTSVGCRTESRTWLDSFPVDKAKLASTGRNAFFILQPGSQSRYRAGDITLTITVLDSIKLVDGVEARVIEEREEQNAQPIEVSRNYFAIDSGTNDVYYFGEDVDIYSNGQVVGHEGAWLSGLQGARFGLALPGSPDLGDRYYQEVAPNVAMDRAEIVATNETVETPAGTFMNCLHIKETTPLGNDVSHKWYAPNVGLVRDDEFVLVEVVTPQP